MALRFGLKESTIEKICGVFARYPQVDQAILYGSRAQGDYKDSSDIDLTLRGKGLTVKLLFQISEELDDLLLPYTIDLSIFRRLTDPDFTEYIRNEGVVFYDRKPPQ